MSQIRFRYNAALAIAGLVAMIGTLPLLGASLYFAPVLLIPLAVAVWGWRAGTDVDERGLVVRALLAKRGIPWTQVDALVPEQRRVHARLANGRMVTLPAVSKDDLPKLLAASGATTPANETSGATTPANDASDATTAAEDATNAKDPGTEEDQ